MRKGIATVFLTAILPSALLANPDGLSSDLLNRANSKTWVPSAALGAAVSGVDRTFPAAGALETGSRAAVAAFGATPGGMTGAAAALEGIPQTAFGMPASGPDRMAGAGAMGALGGVPAGAVVTPASNSSQMVGALGGVPQAAVVAPASNPGTMAGAAEALGGAFRAAQSTALMMGNAANAERQSTNVPVGLRSFSATGTAGSR